MTTYTAFAGDDRIATGSLAEVAPAMKAAWDAGRSQLLAFDDSTGRLVELDLRGDLADVLERLAPPPIPPAGQRGRPKLGVKAREVTLLPGQWDWLASQPGGASATLRRLVDQARRSGPDLVREAQEAAHRVMFALAGDMPDFEEANRAFYAYDFRRFAALTASWPADVRQYVQGLAKRVEGAGAG